VKEEDTMDTFRRVRIAIAGLALISASLATATTAASADDDFRNIRVHLTNTSDSKLILAGKTLDHGCWTDEPPATIDVDETVDIASESCGLGTGTEFHAKYTLELTGTQMSLHYSNPTAGSDTFNEAAPQGYTFDKGGVVEDRSATFRCDSTTCDGIPDEWKLNGVRIDPGDGKPTQFVDLPAMGATLDRPNVFVHLDWMADGSNNQRLTQDAIDTVIKAFDREPVTHRGATRPGINLIVDAGPTSTLSPGGPKWLGLSRAEAVDWTQDFLTKNDKDRYQFANFYSLMNENFVPTGRLPIFHYGVAVAGLSPGSCTSGVAPANKLGFMVSLSGVGDDGTACGGTPGGSDDEQAGTFMHEFGHILGLDHSGGDGNADEFNYKPNYPSIMNYAYQLKGGAFRNGTQVIDFLRDDTIDADESTLTEPLGITIGPNPSKYGTNYRCTVMAPGGGTEKITRLSKSLGPVDWDCSDTAGDNGKPGFDANGSGKQTTLNGVESDWSRLDFKTGGVGAGANAKDTVAIPSEGLSAPNPEMDVRDAALIRVLPLDSGLTYTGANSAAYHDEAEMSATLTDPFDDSPIQGKRVAFRLGTSAPDSCSATTNADGVASCSFSVTQVPGTYLITAAFAGDSIYKASSDTSQTFTITKKETTLTLTSPTVVLAGSTNSTVSAELTEGSDADGPPPDPYGQTITFTLGDQSCTGTTDAEGEASCDIADVTGESLGERTLTATFDGDTYYLPSSDSAEVIVFAFPSKGAFVLGDSTVAEAPADSTVTWWSDEWSLKNDVSGGPAPEAFKGFAGSVTSLPTTTPANVCGTAFDTRPGNSPPPTSEVPEYMGVLVADSVTKSGATIEGTWAQIVVVETNAGYQPDPGHPGTAKVIATFCP
jgi:hypothetical protein